MAAKKKTREQLEIALGKYGIKSGEEKQVFCQKVSRTPLSDLIEELQKTQKKLSVKFPNSTPTVFLSSNESSLRIFVKEELSTERMAELLEEEKFKDRLKREEARRKREEAKNKEARRLEAQLKKYEEKFKDGRPF